MWHALITSTHQIYINAIVNKHVFMNLVSLEKNLALHNHEIWLDCACDLN